MLDLPDLARRRARMVQEQLRNRGIRDERVLAAMAKVPREQFVAARNATEAYGDHPMPIGEGQTISQPYMVALMVEVLELQPNDRVLEVGTGSGYEAAVLGEVAAEVWSVEYLPELAEQAAATVQRLGYGNIRVVQGDGSLGLRAQAPFQAILVAAAAPSVPASLIGQLAEGGRLAIPVGTRSEQQLKLVRKVGGATITTSHAPCRFVPLLGAEGFRH